MAFKSIGKNAPRLEDPAILTGQGVYVGDVVLPRMLHIAVLRSPYPHARIVSVDTSAARTVPGVVAVVTGRDLPALVGKVPQYCQEPISQDAIAIDKVRFEGESVAAVAALDRATAEDACERIRVDYEPLPSVVDPYAALAPDAPLLHDTLDSNLAWEKCLTFGDVDGDFAEADHVLHRTMRWHRMSAQAIETAGVVVNYESATGKMTVWSNANMTNMFAASFAQMLQVSTSRLNLIPCLSGGNFGSKLSLGKNMCIAAAFAKLTGRPTRYIDDRLEHVQAADNTACDRYYDCELAVRKDGTFVSLTIDVVDDQGAYFNMGPTSHGNAMATPTGPYRIRSLRYKVKAVLTNKVGQAVFRGAGAEPGNFILERLVDAAATELGIDRVEIRHRNFIRPSEFPYRTPQGNIYDSGDYGSVLALADGDERVQYWRRAQERARSEGRYVGIGLATCQERTTYVASEVWLLYDHPPVPVTTSPETVDVTIDAMGQAFVTLGGMFIGNSPQTIVAQMLAEELGLEAENIAFRFADSEMGVVSPGPGGSRSTVMLAGAVAGAARELKEKLFRIAEEALEAAYDDLVLEDGHVSVKGSPDHRIPVGTLAAMANLFALDLPPNMSSGLRSSYRYDHPFASKPSDDRSDLGAFYPIVSHGCHVAVVEVDIDTGIVTPLAYLAVNDCGTVVNPRLLDGQVRGGVVQGIGAALSEEYSYAESGAAETRDYMTYLIPTADLVPAEFRVVHHETPSPFTQYGVKGAGEGGRLVAPAAMASAIEDALRPLGVPIDELPMTPGRLLSLIAHHR